MRILTVRQPYANAIIFDGKNVENRSRNIAGSYRGPIAIHAAVNTGTSVEHDTAERNVEAITGHPCRSEPRGVIIGVVDLVGVHRHGTKTGCYKEIDVLGWWPLDGSDASEDGWTPRTCSPWAIEGGYHLELAKPRPLASPINYTGALGLRNLEQLIAAQIRGQVAQ